MPALDHAARGSLRVRRKAFGFTMIELLIAVSIMAVLTGIGAYSFTNAQIKSRDAHRKQELAQIKAALELYYQDNKSYPPSPATCPTTAVNSVNYAFCSTNTKTDNSWIPGLTPYMQKIPNGLSLGPTTEMLAGIFAQIPPEIGTQTLNVASANSATQIQSASGLIQTIAQNISGKISSASQQLARATKLSIAFITKPGIMNQVAQTQAKPKGQVAGSTTVTFSQTTVNDDGSTSLSYFSYPPVGSATVTAGNNYLPNYKNCCGSLYQVYDSYIRWDTSSIPDNATITSANIILTPNQTSQYADARNVVGEWYNWVTLSSSDFSSSVGNSAFSKPLSTITTTGAQYTITLNNVSSVNKTGYTGLRMGIDGGTPSGNNVAVFYTIGSNSGAAVPQLQVTYSVSAPPIMTTSSATSITSTGATLNGTGNPNSQATTGWFRYSTTNPSTCNDTFGTRIPASSGTSLGSGSTAVAYSSTVTGLSPATTYWYCAIGSNADGTAWGNPLSFATTNPIPPSSVTTNTLNPGYDLDTTAVLSGNANPNGAATTGWFRLWTTSTATCSDAGGTRVPTTGGSALGSGTVVANFTQNATVIPSTQYWYCAIANNATGTTVSSNVVTFTTAPPAPTNLLPTGSADLGLQNITWNAATGAAFYYLRVNDLSDATGSTWSPSVCDNGTTTITTGDLCQNPTGTSYAYNFQAGHTYNVWVHSANAAGYYSNPTANYNITVTIPSPTNLQPSGSVTYGTVNAFTWNAVSGATTYTIQVDDTNVAGGVPACVASSPPTTGDLCYSNATTNSFTYTFTSGHTYNWNVKACSGATCGTATTATATITAPSPVINTFCSAGNCPGTGTASIYQGQSITLTWTSTNTTSCSGTVPANWQGTHTASNDSVSVSPAATTTYTLSCTNGTTAVTQNFQVVVNPPPPVPTVSLNADKTAVTVGQTANLTWTSTNAVSCTASGAGDWTGSKPVNSVSPTTVSPTAPSATYTLTCLNALAQPESSSVTVSVSTIPVSNQCYSVLGYCYIAIPDANGKYTSFFLWAQLENKNDKDVYTRTGADCTGDSPNPSTFNYCVKND